MLSWKCPVAVMGLVLLAGCGSSSPPETTSTSTVEAVMFPDVSSFMKERHAVPSAARFKPRFQNVLNVGSEYRAVIKLQKGGEIELVFFPEVAPNHVASFVALARQGFYDNTTFHRVIEGFMAQGGDPTGTGSGGPGYNVPAEFSRLPHRRGTLSMARASDPNSAGSQFFICLAEAPYLNNEYSVFGHVVKGMEHVDGLKRRDPNENPQYRGDAIKTIRIIESAGLPPESTNSEAVLGAADTAPPVGDSTPQ